MALVKCKECKADVSSFAKVCPKCGVKDPGTKWWHKLVAAVVLVFVVVFLLSRCSSGDNESQAAAGGADVDQQVITPSSSEQQVLSLADQCSVEGKVFTESDALFAELISKFPLDSKLDYQEVAKYRVNFFNKELSKIGDQLKGIRTTHLADDVVIRYAADISVRTGFVADSLYKYSRSGNVDDLKSLRDQLAEITKSHKNAMSECKKISNLHPSKG